MVGNSLLGSLSNYLEIFVIEHALGSQNLSRSEPVASGGAAARAAQAKKEKKKRMPKLEEFLQSRDYVGAMTLLDVSLLLLFVGFTSRSGMCI